jgi:hypothetical protein
VCACTALLVAAGTHARRPVIEVTVIKSGASRQNIRIDPAAIPPVTIDPAVSRINVSLSPRTARELVRDLLADLAIEAEALKQRSETLLTTADVGPRYLKAAKTIADTAPTAEIVVSDYELDTAKIVLRRTNFQSGPQIAARVTGTVRRVGYRGSSAGRVITGRTRFARTFVFLHVDDHYFIATDLP